CPPRDPLPHTPRGDARGAVGTGADGSGGCERRRGGNTPARGGARGGPPAATAAAHGGTVGSVCVKPLPETGEGRAGEGVHLAYQVVGTGLLDLVWLPDWWNHVEAQWEEPRRARFLERLASFSRLIVFNKRGTGLSDPIPLDHLPTLESWMEDLTV